MENSEIFATSPENLDEIKSEPSRLEELEKSLEQSDLNSYLDETNLTISRRALTYIVVAIHFSCALTRPVMELDIDGIEIFGIISTISWTVYLLFITGIIILLNRRVGSLVNSDFILVPALSLAWMIVFGLISASIGPILLVSNPLQWWTFGYISLLSSSILFYRYSLRPNRFHSISLTLDNPSKWAVAISLSVMMLGVMGPTYLNQTNSFWPSALCVLALSTIILLADRGGVFGDYLIIYSSSLSILLIHSLVSDGLVGTDIQKEFFYANRVLETGSIDLISSHHYSTVLSTQIILPMLSATTTLSLQNTLKILYPIIYSFIPVLLYFSYSQAFSRNIAFFSTLLTVFSFPFYTTMLNVLRQGIAEVFLLSGIVLLLSSESLRMYRLRIFVIPFLIMMTVSHYSINYILYPLLWLSYITMIGLKQLGLIQDIFTDLEISPLVEDSEEEIPVVQFENDILLDEEGIATFEELQTRAISNTPLLNFWNLFFGTFFVLIWHSISGGGSVISSLSQIASDSRTSFQEKGILGSFFSSQPTETVIVELGPLTGFTRNIYLITTLLSFVGIYLSLSQRENNRPINHLLIIAIASWALFLPFFLVPRLAIYLEFVRIYHWLLMFIAPFSLIGLLYAFRLIQTRLPNYSPDSLNFVAPAFVGVFLIMSSGVTYGLSENDNNKMAFDSEMQFYRFNEFEEVGANWIVSHSPEDSQIVRPCVWADKYNSFIFTKIYGYKSYNTASAGVQSQLLFVDEYNLERNGFFFNTLVGEEYHRDQFYELGEITPSQNLHSRSVIYESGGSTVYHQEECLIDEKFRQVIL